MSLSELVISLPAALVGPDVQFTGCSTDSRTLKAGEMFIALRGEHFDGYEFVSEAKEKGASAAMLDRKPEQALLPSVIVDNSRIAMGKLASYWRSRFDIPLIAVTGSNGKTTVKEMISSILSLQAPVLSTHGNFNNDIGVPLTLFGLASEHRYSVIEMGANHPKEISWLSRIARPTVAVITQCAPAHLQGFGSIKGVALAKAEIYEGLTQNGIVVINADDEYASLWKKQSLSWQQINFGLINAADVTATDICTDQNTNKNSFTLQAFDENINIDLSLPGRHNVQNALAATACCIAVDIPLKLVKTGLEKIIPCKGRLQIKQGIKGSCIYDDTYNANPASLEAALKVLTERAGRHWLVLGDMGELGTEAQTLHYQAGEIARNYGVEKLYALGQLSQYAVEGFGAGAKHFNEINDLISSIRTDLDSEITILVKGSRAMAMERIVTSLGEGF